jgi:hypothetical protein
MTRSVRGIVLTAAGQAFLEHAKLTLAQAQLAAEAARRAASPPKPSLAVGVLVGHEADWLPRSTGLLRDELFRAEIKVSSGFSTTLARDLQHGTLDVAFLRHETDTDLAFKLVEKEPLVAILPSDHPLASSKAVHPKRTVAGLREESARLKGAQGVGTLNSSSSTEDCDDPSDEHREHNIPGAEHEPGVQCEAALPRVSIGVQAEPPEEQVGEDPGKHSGEYVRRLRSPVEQGFILACR